MIYADYAATTALSLSARKAMQPYLADVYGNPSSTHSAGAAAARGVLLSRELLSANLHCRPREITFTSGGSEANNQALYTLAAWGRQAGKMHFVTSAFEHPSVLRVLEYLETCGFSVTRVPPQPNGMISPAAVEQALRPDTVAVSCMLANNEVGTIQPIAEIAAICRAHDILLHTDAVQAVGHIPVDFSLLGADCLTLSAHKFHGPKGIGALLARGGITPFPLIRGGGQERGCRAGTENAAGIAGMAAALSEQCRTMAANAEKTAALRDELIAGLQAIPEVFLTCGETKRVPGTAHFCIAGVESETMLALLDERGICASAGSACSAGALEESHVLQSLAVPPELAKGAIRFSLGEGSTSAEVKQIISAARECIFRLRGHRA